MNPFSVTPRLAIFLIFLVHGLLVGFWVPHLAFAQLRLNLTTDVFGLSLLAIAAGAILAMPLTGIAINRQGSARITCITAIFFALAISGPVLSPNLISFMVAGFLLGAAMGSMDVAMNAQGLAIEKFLNTPIMSQLHGGFSIGTMAGTFLASALFSHITPIHFMLSVGILSLVVFLALCPWLLPTKIDQGQAGSHFARPSARTITLGLLCFLALMSEGAMLDWSTILLAGKFTLSTAQAAYGYGFFSAGMALSRFTGDRLRAKFGGKKLVISSAILLALSFAAALVMPYFWVAIGFMFLSGMGIGNLAPVLFAGGGRLEPEAPGRGIAAVTTLGYAGFLIGPPLIGGLAAATSLNLALFVIPLAALIIAVSASHIKTLNRS